jgi:hypothetical protein
MSVELFDWEGRWDTEIRPLLDRPVVKKSLMQYQMERGRRRARQFMGTPFLPYQCGREPDAGWELFTKTDLRAYCPVGECHWIYKFCLAVSRILRPELEWGVAKDETHTVAIGYRKGAEGAPQFKGVYGRIEMVSDILMSKKPQKFGAWSAEDSLAYAGFWKYCCSGIDNDIRVERERLTTPILLDRTIRTVSDFFLWNKDDITPKVMDAIYQEKLYLG